VEDWAEIRRLHRAEGLPIKTIARTLGISRNTVRGALASAGPPKYERRPAGSAVDAFEDAIRAQLKDVPTMPGWRSNFQSEYAGSIPVIGSTNPQFSGTPTTPGRLPNRVFGPSFDRHPARHAARNR
jgi:transposase